MVKNLWNLMKMHNNMLCGIISIDLRVFFYELALEKHNETKYITMVLQY